jgi:hypothetical protein
LSARAVREFCLERRPSGNFKTPIGDEKVYGQKVSAKFIHFYVAVGMPVTRHPPHRSVYNHNRLYLTNFIDINNNNKYALWKCGKTIDFSNKLPNITAFVILWFFHKTGKTGCLQLWKNHFLFSYLYSTIERVDYGDYGDCRPFNLKPKEWTMGRQKYFRFNIQQQIQSLQYKNKYFYLKNINISRYGLCLAEAELLAELANDYYQNQLLDVPENNFAISLYQNFHSNKKQNLQSLTRKTVTIPAFSHYELDIYLQYGLKALQSHRIVNILDSIAFQNSKIDINLLAKIVNITPKSIRERLIPFFKMGVGFPSLTYLSDKWFRFKKTPVFRYAKALKEFFIENKTEEEIMEKLLISKMEWCALLFNFFQFSYAHYAQKPFAQLHLHLLAPLQEEISTLTKDIIATSRYTEYSRLYPRIKIKIQNGTDTGPDIDISTDTASDFDTAWKADSADSAGSAGSAGRKDAFYNVLKHYFSFSNALICDYLSFLHKEVSQTNKNRKDGEIIYYAVSQDTIPGTPLSNSEMVPIKLTIFSSGDTSPDSPYHTNTRKWNKAQRYAIQAQNQKATLSQYDLAFLLGVSISVVKNLMKKHRESDNDSDSDKVIPTRGNMHDIGPGISHAEKIIKLYLEGHTETEIKFKTAHSYESIENYLRKFTKVVGLTDMGLNLNQIRMSAKMTYNLAAKFLEIYERYNTEEYGWILAKIRNNFNQTIRVRENGNGNGNGNGDGDGDGDGDGKKKILKIKRRTRL